MSSWRRYPKIAESTQRWPAEIKSNAGRWVATEKIHGANFSAHCAADGTVEFASRSGLLSPADNFFGFRSQGLDATLAVRARALRDVLVGTHADADACIIIYGELCGGHYPHGDVTAPPGVLPVQKGVWYSPDIVFVGFDVFVSAVSTGGGRAGFLDFEIARTASLSAGFHYAEPLFVGDLAGCLSFDSRFTSRLATQTLGLPPLGGPNLAEGLVVRPLQEPSAAASAAGSGSGNGGGGSGGGTYDRKLLKRKIAEFSEKQYSNPDWRGARGGGGGGDGAGADAESLLRYEMMAAVTEQRLDNVVSKVGRVDPHDRAACRALLDELMRDVEQSLLDEALLAGDNDNHHHIHHENHNDNDDNNDDSMHATPLCVLNARFPTLATELELACRKLVVTFLRGEQGRRSVSQSDEPLHEALDQLRLSG